MSCVQSDIILVEPKICIDFDISGPYEFVRLIIKNDSTDNPTIYSLVLYPPLTQLTITISDLYPYPRAPYYGNHHIRLEYYGKDNDDTLYLMHYEDRTVYLMPLEVQYSNNQCEEKVVINFTYQFANCENQASFIHYIEDEDGNYIPNTHSCEYDNNTDIMSCKIFINTDEFTFSKLKLDSVIQCGNLKVQFSHTFDVCTIDFDYAMVYIPAINKVRFYYTFRNCTEDDGFLDLYLDANRYTITYTNGFVSGYIDLDSPYLHNITFSVNDECFCSLQPNNYQTTIFYAGIDVLNICDKVFCVYITSASYHEPQYDPFYGFYKIKILDNNDNVVFTSAPISNINGTTSSYCFDFTNATLTPGEYYNIIVVATNNVIELDILSHEFLWHEINFNVIVSNTDTTIEVIVNPSTINILEYNITVYNTDNTIFFETSNIDAPDTFTFIVNSVYVGNTAKIRYTYKFEDELGKHTYTCEKIIEVESESNKKLVMWGIGAFYRTMNPNTGDYEINKGTMFFLFHPYNTVDLENNIIDSDCDYLETAFSGPTFDSLNIIGFTDFSTNVTIYYNNGVSYEFIPLKLNSWAGTRQVIGSFTCPSDSNIINFNFNNIKIPFCGVDRIITTDINGDKYVNITVTYKGVGYDILVDSINDLITSGVYSGIIYGIDYLTYRYSFMYSSITVNHANQEVIINENFIIIPFSGIENVKIWFIGGTIYNTPSQVTFIGLEDTLATYSEEFSASDLNDMYPYMFDYCNVTVNNFGDAIFEIKLRKRHSFIHKIKLSFTHSNGTYSQTIDIRAVPSHINTFSIVVPNAASTYAGQTIHYTINLYFTVPNSPNVIYPTPPAGTDILLRDSCEGIYIFQARQQSGQEPGQGQR